MEIGYCERFFPGYSNSVAMCESLFRSVYRKMSSRELNNWQKICRLSTLSHICVANRIALKIEGFDIYGPEVEAWHNRQSEVNHTLELVYAHYKEYGDQSSYNWKNCVNEDGTMWGGDTIYQKVYTLNEGLAY